MVTVEFAASLRRHADYAPQTVAPGTLRAVLEAALHQAPRLKTYVLDDQGLPRKHVALFVNAHMVRERQQLTQPVRDGDRVLVVQALSGG